MSTPNSNDERRSTDAEVASMKEQALRSLLSPQARLRLTNVRMVKPELASMVENYLIGMASQGKLNTQISDEQLKQILQSIQQPKRDFKINRL
ncbi:MAG: DNA-binding protein [Thaumarchaeota archaeon]|nr:MAG: DNA-binding protein [Nitrososphaerota archaeon]TLX82398.1 MAG: DNA-binding protein [Nitrososphaerota archaeon]